MAVSTLKLHGKSYGVLRPYVIAEIGVNHEGHMALAKKMIDQVARAGGHAAKFQTYKAEKIASEGHSPAYWDLISEPSRSQYELFKKYDTFGKMEYQELADHCRSSGIDFLSTPFDLDSVDFLAPLVPLFKVASADITNIPLLRRIGSWKKPVVVSTGGASIEEIERAIEILKKAGAPHLGLLHCVLNYPTPPDHAQLGLMDRLLARYGSQYPIGYSDHVPPSPDGSLPALEWAVLRGAVVIEKHFTYDKSCKGNDHYHAMDEEDLTRFMTKIQLYEVLQGSGDRNPEWEMKAVLNARRRIIAADDIDEGEVLTDSNVIALRSDVGIEVAHWDEILGRTTVRPLKKGNAIVWADLDAD